MRIQFPGNARGARRFLILALVSALAAGCGSGHVSVPRYDPDAIAQRAMEEYDKNKDGRLDDDELEKCPALKNALLHININTEKQHLNQEDIAERLRSFQESKVGLTAVRCRVTQRGLGIKGVTVTFVPEKFMGNAVKPASGVSEDNGMVELKVAGESIPGVSLGYYRIEASMKDESGKELLPPTLNTDTRFGQEVHNDRQGMEFVRIPLD